MHEVSVTVIWPPNVSPEVPKLDRGNESTRAARQAKQKATSEYQYRDTKEDRELFTTSFEAAVASKFAKEGRPVTFTEVFSEMTDMTKCAPKISKTWKETWSWDGFIAGRWEISRAVPGTWRRAGEPRGTSQVAFPKGSTRDKDAGRWRFSSSRAGGPV